MFRLLFLIIAFYIIYKGIKLFLTYFIPAVKSQNNFKRNPPSNQGPKYNKKDIEEAEFTEIKSDKETGKE